MTLISELSEEALGIRGNLGPISVTSYKIVCLLYIYSHWDFFAAEPEIVWFGCARSVLGRAEGASMHRATGPWSLQTAAQLRPWLRNEDECAALAATFFDISALQFGMWSN